MRSRRLLVLAAPLLAAASLALAPPAAAMSAASCQSGVRVTTAGRAPQLPGLLAGALKRYAREAPAGASTLDWYDSGGRFGGGVPVRSVEGLVGAGLARGLSQEQVSLFLNPGLLRGMGDPNGGGSLLAFIAARGDAALLSELVSYSGDITPSIGGPMEAQRSFFAAFPLLNVVYEAQAGVPPLDEAGAAVMTDLALSGYVPAQRAIDRILAGGNHPRTGAQGSGSVADGVRPEVYDFFVANYDGPLSVGARTAVANRQAYLAWVDRIASWAAGGSSVDQIPSPATFQMPMAPPSTAWSPDTRGSSCAI